MGRNDNADNADFFNAVMLILILAVLILGGFIFYDKVLNNNSNKGESNITSNPTSDVTCSDCVKNIIIDDINSLNKKILVDGKVMQVNSKKVCIDDGDIGMCYYQLLVDENILIDKYDEAYVKSLHVLNGNRIMVSLIGNDNQEIFEFYDSNFRKISLNNL